MTDATLNLDARQRAMLDEMGVKVWWPVRAPAPVVVTPPAEDVAAPTVEDNAQDVPARFDDEALDAPARAPAPAPRPAAPARPSVAQIPSPVPPASGPPAAAPAAARGPAVLVDAPQLLHGADNATGGWLVVADMPPEADGRHGAPFSGDAGRLLENMLRALQLHAGPTPVHLVRTHRGVASTGAQGLQSFDDHFMAQAAALAPRVVLAMGPLAAQSLLQSGEPLGKLRGRAGRAAALGDVPVVATYHPAYLVRTPADKGRAWADLCLAAELFDRAGA
ncbi:uracil-DNA glycosylase family protein [Variovorax ginsengisoli]|uniref:DNA polymerase n=1 Tax=Variovorax ginsengisoli TaxID=363844 RepID=A0ABT9S7G7_9BURK|nr:uracil-DNA glycosylase family protein [Variovorax ginsengisoli]MDP9900299.1 DNA polymerase [Variovorax ginsengisoli]